uniref:Family with sequence similarity 183 member A n=1 Tax=Mastacembelus armatus TaxID=205130 RepID=A0A7N8WLH4_9TELE
MCRKPTEVVAENCKFIRIFLKTTEKQIQDKTIRCSSVTGRLFFSADFIKTFHDARQEPTKKYTMPLTESQEIGWVSAPLIPANRNDERFNFFRSSTDTTKISEK